MTSAHSNCGRADHGRSLKLVVAGALMMFACDANTSNDDQAPPSPASGEATTGLTKMDNKSPETRHDREEFERLTAADIRARLVGHTIMPERNGGQLAFQFSEDFFPDGRWVTRRSQRGPTIARGTWQIVGDQMCVAEAGRSMRCRDVWINSASGKIMMQDVGSTQGALLMMSTHPLRSDAQN